MILSKVGSFQNQYKVFTFKFVEFYIQRLLKNPYYKYKSTKIDESCFENFLIWCDEQYDLTSLGRDFLEKYVEYQFDYWYALVRKKITDKNYNSVRFSWIFGDKARQRWVKFQKDPKRISQYWLKIRQQRDIQFSDFVFQTNVKVLKIHPTDELERGRYLNTEAGLLWCIDNTDLFHPLSQCCAECIYQSNCKKLLVENYHHLSKVRNVNI